MAVSEVKDVRLEKLNLTSITKKKTLKVALVDAIMSADLERTIEGASTLTLTVHDPDRELLRSGALTGVADVELDGLWYRLVSVNKFGSDLTLVFEDRVIAYLRGYKKYRKAKRSQMTRAQFAKLLVDEVKQQKLKFISPELTQRQPIAARTAEERAEADEQRDYGFGSDETQNDLTVKGRQATTEQIKNAGIILATGLRMGARYKVLISSIMTAIQESVLINMHGGDRDSVGVFQQRPSQGWPATRNVAVDAQAYFEHAIAEDKKYPNLELWALCQNVQRSAYPRAYARWEEEAVKFVNAYGVDGDTPTGSITRTQPYLFTRGQPGQPEDTWTALGRLADEVGWRRFVVSGSVYFISEKKLMASRPRATISEFDDGVHTVDFSYDSGRKKAEVTMLVNLGRWDAPPGTVVALKDMGPASGRWLVASVRRSLFSPNATVTLKKAQPKLPEPAATTTTTGAITEGDFQQITGGTMRERIVAVARYSLAHGDDLVYEQVRPYPRERLTSPKIKGKKADCSSWFIMCYRDAGAEDPNGSGFNGYGNTDSLRLRGRRTNAPIAGDAVFYGPSWSNTTHVDLYIGGGKTIGFGSEPVKEGDVNRRGDLLGYMTFKEADADVPGSG